MSKRVQSNVLDWFRDNDVVRMRLLTQELFFSGFFVPFLTPSQYNVLERVTTTSLDIWQAFWEGQLSLTVSEDTKSDEHEDDEEHGAEDAELAFKTGQNAIKALMNITRCLLYEKAVNYYYSNKPCIEFENVLNKELKQTSTKNESESNPPKPERDEDNDYDDDDDDDDGEEDEQQKKENDDKNINLEDSMDVDLPKTEDGLTILTITKQDMLAKPKYPPLPGTNSVDDAVAQNIHPILGSSSVESNPDVSLQKINELILIKNFNKIYHTFENDVVNIMKKRKLERSNKQLEEDDEDDESNNTNNDISNNESNEMDNKVKLESENTRSENVTNLISFGGAVNLTMKNLLNRIEEKRDDMNITDIELKNLIMDVRKNRSKWSNYNRIGQEELYEACEKVVTELRGYTEHSTPFLNKVSKREAPNYYEVIKKPMDLNTVLKNLKQLHYTNKQQFVDDLMLIWQNCLMYNSDPKHFIRKDAIAMRKKALTLIPLIPDITIRDRIDVEREAAALALREKAEEENEQKGRKSTRGVGTGKKSSKKGRVNNLIEIKDENDLTNDFEDVKEPVTIEPTNVPEEELQQQIVPNTTDKDTVISPSTANGLNDINSDLKEDSTAIVESAVPTSSGQDVEEEERNLQETKQQGAEGEPDDLETATWKSLTSASRYRLCVDRSRLFKNGKIQPEAEALLRDTNQMWNFENCLHEDPAASEKYRMSSKAYLDSGAIMHRSRQYFDETDDPYLLEYDISGGIPELKHDNTPIQEIEDNLIENLLASGKTLDSLPDSTMKINSVGGSSIVLENIGIMQDIRRVCFKINLIRQLQVNKYVHQSQFIAPEIRRIKLQDIDPLGKLPTRDLMTENIAHVGMQKAVSALVMHNGFESTKPSCAMMLTQIAETYMGNLAKSLNLHMESNSINKQYLRKSKASKLKSMLEIVLCENGVENPDTLYAYYKESLVKKNQRLADIKVGLDNFLKDLLRPSIQEMSESQFADGSDQFVNGEFSDEIGDDFFGFKELGLDKEFSMLTSSIPLHLLQSKLGQHLSNVGKTETNKSFSELSELEFPQLTKKTLYELPAIMVPYLEELLSKSKVNYHKALKKYHQEVATLKEQQQVIQPEASNTASEKETQTDNGNQQHQQQHQQQQQQQQPLVENGSVSASKQLLELSSQFTEYTNDDDIPLMETKDLSMKQRNARAKVPPSGKIIQIKKKNINLAFSFKRQEELEGKMDRILERVKAHRKHLEEEKQNGGDGDGDGDGDFNTMDDGKSIPNQSNENEEEENNDDEDDEEDEEDEEIEEDDEEEEQEQEQEPPIPQSSQNAEEDDDDEDDDMVDAIDNDIF